MTGHFCCRLPALQVLLAAMILATAIVSILVGSRLAEGLRDLRQVPQDNVQWALAQLEVDHVRFLNAVLRARERAASVDRTPLPFKELRIRFDILYSRISTLSEGQVFEELRASPDGFATIERLQEFLAETATIVDRDDGVLLGLLPDLLQISEEAFPHIRGLSLLGIELFAAAADRQRAELERQLILAAGGAATLVFLILTFLMLTLREHRLAERRREEIVRSQARLNSVARASFDAIVVIDRAAKIAEFNKAAEDMFGYTKGEVMGQSIAELLVPASRRTSHRARLLRLFGEGDDPIDAERVETLAVRRDGTEFPIELSVRSIRVDTDVSIVAFVRDITQQKAAARAVEEARDRAVMADQAKSRFVAVMSHEMRTPLNGLVGMLDLIHAGTTDPAQRERVEIAITSGEILKQHVDDVLDIAQLESNRMELADHPTDMVAVAEQVLNVVRVDADRKGLRLTLTVNGMASVVCADPHRIRQVLTNLTGNAVKFTDEGEVGVEIEARPVAGGELALVLRVRDTGPGIPEAERGRIFDDFVMLESDYDRRTSGSGLGLAITRRIVEAMGGAISVEEATGGGSLFIVTLTFRQAEIASEWSADDTALDQISDSCDVLLVEDNAINREVVRRMLESAGHTVTEAVNGFEGVRLATTRQFDIVLMDVSMPGMDGVEATKAIRGLPAPHGSVRIVGLTAHALPAEQARFAEAGMDECLVKPIRLSALTAVLSRTSAWSRPGGFVGDVNATDSEDDPINVETMSEIAATMSEDEFGRLIARITDELREVVPQLQSALQTDDLGSLAGLAHRLTGSVGLFGAGDLTAALSDLETAAKLEKPSVELEACLSRVRSASELTVTVLEEISPHLA